MRNWILIEKKNGGESEADVAFSAAKRGEIDAECDKNENYDDGANRKNRRHYRNR